jgi:hypothetical protein
MHRSVATQCHQGCRGNLNGAVSNILLGSEGVFLKKVAINFNTSPKVTKLVAGNETK